MAKTKELEKVETQEETFSPFCGVHDVFDPSETSECVTLCKVDNPDAFAACEEYNKSKPAPKKKTKTVSTRGKTVWGHVIGTQAGLIDVCLHEATEPVTLEAIADFSDGRLPRVLHHLKHLVTDVKVEVNFLESNKGIFWAGAAFASGIEEKPKTITAYDLRKKVAPKKEAAPEPKKDADPVDEKKDIKPEPKKEEKVVEKKKPAAKKKKAAKKKDGKKSA